MTIKKPIPITFNLDSHNSVQSVCAVIHIDDKNTETLDLSLMQGGEHIAISTNSTVTARFVRVKDKILISDNAACTVQENGNIYIPIDNAAAHMLVGEIKIEVNIVDENDILTMQFPLVVRVNNTILADTEISPESEGTIPELLEEAREAAESATQAAEAATEAISAKQDKLTAGENITITEENVISASSGSNDYTELENKPSINNVTLSGNKSSDDLNLQDKLTAGNNITIEGNVISASGGGVTDYNELENKPILQIQSTSGTTENITLENVIKLFPFYKDIWTDYVQIDDSTYYQTEPTGITSLTSFDDLLYRSMNAVKLYGVEPEGIPQFINAKDNKFIIFSFGVPHDYSSQLILWIDEITSNQKMAYRICEYNHSTHQYNTRDFIEIGSGGSQIVSGVVNVNGTITFTDSKGDSFTTSGESVIGPQGAPGQDYVLTAQDKTDIANIVLGELPTTEGVLYGNQSN